MSVMFIETCAMPYSSINQPIALVAPGAYPAASEVAVGIPDHLARDRIALADGTALFAHVEGDGVGAARGGGIEVEIHGDQEIARTDGRGARAGYPLVERTRPEIGRRLLVRQLFG